MNRALKRYLEVCEEGSHDFSAWSGDLLGALSTLMEPYGVGVSAFLPAQGQAVLSAHDRRFDPIARVIESGVSPDVQRAGYTPFRVTTAARQLGASGFAQRKESLVLDKMGVENMWGMGATTSQMMVVVVIPQWRNGSLAPDRRRLLRLQRHLAGAVSRRAGPEWTEQIELMLDANGTLIHADSQSPLLMQARAIGRAFARECAARDDVDADAQHIWDALWRGGWSVEATTDECGKRVLIVKRIRTDERLTEHEKRVIGMAAKGATIKEIASDLGVATSTVATQLHAGLAKLGIRDRIALSRIVPDSA